MDIIIPDINLRNIWQSVWDRLPQEARAELHDVILLVNAEYSTNISGPFLYGAYSPDTIARRGTIFFYYEDLYSLSDVAKAGVMAHELGHAYCHLKFGDPSPYGTIDSGANCVASLWWGFNQELQAFEQEKTESH